MSAAKKEPWRSLSCDEACAAPRWCRNSSAAKYVPKVYRAVSCWVAETRRPLPLQGSRAKREDGPSTSLGRDRGSTRGFAFLFPCKGSGRVQRFFSRPLPFEGIVAQREDFAVRFPCKGSGFNRGICRPLPLEGIVQGNSNGMAHGNSVGYPMCQDQGGFVDEDRLILYGQLQIAALVYLNLCT